MNKKRILILLILFTAVLGFTINNVSAETYTDWCSGGESHKTTWTKTFYEKVYDGHVVKIGQKYYKRYVNRYEVSVNCYHPSHKKVEKYNHDPYQYYTITTTKNPKYSYKLLTTETTKKNPNSDYNKLKKKGKYYYDTSTYKLKASTVYTVDKYNGKYGSNYGIEEFINTKVKINSKTPKQKIKSVTIYYYPFKGKLKHQTFKFKKPKTKFITTLKPGYFHKVKVNYKT